MRIERVAIQGFGRFEGFDSGPEPLAPLTVVTGPNESGKSTFFSFLTTLLYGFSPATLDRHPYAPWTGNQMEGEATVQLEDGTRLRLHRKLHGVPWGRVVTAGSETDLRNRPLSQVEHVPRSVFTQVYALTLAELGHLEGATWTAIQDRMIASLIADDVRAAREVIEELRAEAGALWRPNRRGHQSARQLAEDQRELQQRRREAADRDARVRTLDRSWSERRDRLGRLREERVALSTRAERLERLLPDALRLERLDALASHPVGGGGDLPLDPRGELQRLEHEVLSLEEQAGQMESRTLVQRARRDRLEMSAAPVAASESQWQRFRAAATRALAAQAEAAARIKELERLEAAAPGADPTPPLPPAGPDPRDPLWMALGAGTAAVVCLALWGRTGAGLLAVAALLLAAAAAWASRLAVGQRKRRATALQARQMEGQRQQAAAAEAARLRERIGALTQEIGAAEQLGRDLASSLGVPASGDIGQTLDEVDRRRMEAREALAEVRSLAEALAASEEDHARLLERCSAAQARRDTLLERLTRLGEGDPENGIRRVERSRAHGAEALRLTEEIRERHGSAEKLREELDRHRKGVGPVDEMTLASARVELQELSEEIEDLRGEVAGREKDVTHLRDGLSVADIDSEIETLKTERARQERERDRKILVAHILEEADRRFRDRHQPDVIRRGAEYVARITSGRYRSLSTGDGAGDAMLYVKHNGGPGVDVSGPLSTGTKEQIYLALRLAVMDHLDSGRERLPLFLDESFVNWDAQRREQGLRLLRELSGSRQVFVFTCHREMTERLQSLGAHVLRLGDGEQVELF